LTGKQPLGFSTPPLADPSTILFCILVPVPCIIHPVVNKHYRTIPSPELLSACDVHGSSPVMRCRDQGSQQEKLKKEQHCGGHHCALSSTLSPHSPAPS
ncbi:hypothetical protein CHARACLAT_031212, partial [Characodon lateralis]|nr:hypothetical protein [Characodon lateralis]